MGGQEKFFGHDEIIVSKTDLQGRILYANPVFLHIAGYTEKEIIGAPHSILRHERMPRCIFQLLWETIAAKKEIFAYVINRTKHDDFYWVLAHVTPSIDADGNVLGYHSSRRVPDRKVLAEKIEPLYAALLAEEKRHANRKDGQKAPTTF